MTNNPLYMSMLFDFYGDLLTEKQREYFDLHYNEDLSLSEIAANAGISRQGVSDMLSRAEKTMLEFEEKTGIVSRFSSQNVKIDEALAVAGRIKETDSLDEAHRCGEQMIHLLTQLKE